MASEIDAWQIADDGDPLATDSAQEQQRAVSPFRYAQQGVPLLPATTERRSLLILPLVMALADLCLYQHPGFGGVAAFFPAVIVLLIAGIPQSSFRPATCLLLAMSVLVTLRLAMNGSVGLIFAAVTLLSLLPLCLRGWPPFVSEAVVFLLFCLPGARLFWQSVRHRANQRLKKIDATPGGRRMLEVLLPAGSAAVFALIFLMANPNLVGHVSHYLEIMTLTLQGWLTGFSLMQLLVWTMAGWLMCGLLRPVPPCAGENSVVESTTAEESALYAAFRRTLQTLSGLFAGYLVFEFITLFTNRYERGFGFSDYAHEGAMWLTVALLLATVMLSVMFRRSTFQDPRVAGLKRLAMLWIGLNLILAVAVYIRLFIYIDYNGMTRMRCIGLLGISSVVCGLAVMIQKIRGQRDFLWLLERQIWTAALAAFLYVVLPVDVLCHRHNVSRILAGDPAPVVQIAVHPIDDEALPSLLPLLQAEQPEIREGVMALLQHRREELSDGASSHWSTWQYSQERTKAVLADSLPSRIRFKNPPWPDKVDEFRHWAMPWY